ncbi:MAG: endonuclease/exonuclease/phosphatase family protein [Rhodoplanes sp.]
MAKRASNRRKAPAKAPTRKPSVRRAAPGTSLGGTTVPENDNITRQLRDLVPDEFEGTDRFLDIVTWNIKWFNLADERRVGVIASAMSEINADIFILQEIEPGAMDPVAEMMKRNGAGYYKVAQGATGGDQRVTILYDIEFAKATTAPMELFTDDPKVAVGSTQKAIFPRRPLRASVTAYAGEDEPFDFELVGVHLKSQRQDRSGDDGSKQRKASAQHLANWMMNDAPDEDVIIAGDWNAVASKPEFSVIRNLESEGKAQFQSFNNGAEASHFFKSGRGTRLDYFVVSASAAAASPDGRSRVISWNALLREGKTAWRWIVDEFSDHLPVISRFYFTAQHHS